MTVYSSETHVLEVMLSIMFSHLIQCIVGVWIVTGSNISATVLTSYACPSKTLILRCENQADQIVVRKAFYGPSGLCSPPTAPMRCIHPDPVGSLARSCHGKNSCLISPSYKQEVFGKDNPCKERVEMFTSVEYDCVPAGTVKTICDLGSRSAAWSRHGYVTSVNYPDHYYNNQTCRGVLRGRPGQVNIAINMLDLEMEYSNTSGLCYDFVVLQQAGNWASTRIYCANKQARIMGLHTVYPLNAASHEVVVKFESSVQVNYRGFLFEYNVTGCANADIPSPPLPYGRLTYKLESQYAQYTCPEGYKLMPPTGSHVICTKQGIWEGTDGNYCAALSTAEVMTVTELLPTLQTGKTGTMTPSSHPSTYTQMDTTKTTTVATMSESNFVRLIIIVGGVSGTTVVAILIIIIVVWRYSAHKYLQKKKDQKSNALSSLRPSAHACVSIPNTYAGPKKPFANKLPFSSIPSNKQHSSTKRNFGGRISYASEIFDCSESMKGSNDPILTISDTSFDCVEVTPKTVQVINTITRQPFIRGDIEISIDQLKGQTNAAFCDEGTYGPKRVWANVHKNEEIDSDLLYHGIAPSLDTILEETTISGTTIRSPVISSVFLVRSIAQQSSQREEADGESIRTNSELVDDISIHSGSSDMKPKVGKRRIRSRALSMGEADQPAASRRIEKVVYGLFKDDDTGNLDNFLEQRRVSV